MPDRARRTRLVLSLILCSRNDSYMGNSVWRLQTALDFLAANVCALGREADVEILVTDWGSDAPLRDALSLSPEAARMTAFISVPLDTAKALQRDSPFAEVIALNVAARRSRGEFIGRIDQDTLVGRGFLSMFFDIADRTRVLNPPLAMGFSNIKYVNYRFAVRCPSFTSVEWFVRVFGPWLKRQNWRSTTRFYEDAVGIWLVRRDVWEECGGYDERMIYMNAMETNMVKRLLPKHQIVDLGAMCNYDFYHLEHYYPWTPRRSSVYRKVNPHLPFSQPDAINPNGVSWGLSDHRLDMVPARARTEGGGSTVGAIAFLRFAGLMVRVLPATLYDWTGLTARITASRFQNTWRRLRGHPVGQWPGLVVTRWKARRSRA